RAQVMKPDRRAALRERDREIRVLHLSRQGHLELLAETPRGVDVPLVAAGEEGGEERESLDVIPMRVRDQEVTAQRRWRRRRQIRFPSVRGCSAVEHAIPPVRRPFPDLRTVPPPSQGCLFHL